MIFKGELAMNHEPSLDRMARDWATENVEEAKAEEARSFDSQYSTCFDYEYEMAWSAIEHDLEQDGLEWEETNE